MLTAAASIIRSKMSTIASPAAGRPSVVIVGGVAGGASCATRLRRLFEGADISVYDKGEFVSFANCGLPYYVGNVIKRQSNLVLATPELFHRRFNINVHTQHEVTGVDPVSRTLSVKSLLTSETISKRYDALVMATGAAAIVPQVPGVIEKDGVPRLPGVFLLRTIPDSERIRAWIEEQGAKSACVIGAAWAGLEIAESLHGRGLAVSVLELAPQVMPLLDPEMSTPLKLAMLKSGVSLHTGEGLSSILPGTEGTKLTVMTTSGGAIHTDMVILSMGVRVENGLARSAGLSLGVRGSVVTDDFMRTSDPHIWAVGDLVQSTNAITGAKTNLQLAGPANKQGRLAAESIAHALTTGEFTTAVPPTTRFRGVQGTAIAGVFGQTVAMTGLTEKQAVAEAAAHNAAPGVTSPMTPCSIWIHPGHHVSYYPGATAVHLKLVFDEVTGRVYGAQAVGEHGIDKRIDVIAMAIQMGATVQQLAQAELCYSPQFGAARDPINIAGMVATNVVQGLAPVAKWSDVFALSTATGAPSIVVLDVRYTDEIEAEGPLTAPDGSVIPSFRVPMPKLRESPECLTALIEALPTPTTPIAVMCREGVRAHAVLRLLRQKGLNAQLLSGGYYTSLLLRGVPFPARLQSKDDDRFPATGPPTPCVLRATY